MAYTQPLCCPSIPVKITHVPLLKKAKSDSDSCVSFTFDQLDILRTERSNAKTTTHSNIYLFKESDFTKNAI